MKVLFCIRKNYIENLGGDTTQLQNTIKYICKKDENFEYVIITEPNEIRNYPAYKIVHIFNMQNYSILKSFVEEAYKNKKCILLSPIYWDLSECIYIERMFRITTNLSLISKFRVFKNLINFNKSSRKYLSFEYRKKYHDILNMVNLFLPNSEEEWRIIQKHFNISEKKVHIIPNALENIDYNASSYMNINDDNGSRDSILVVGRIEPTKNQLGVLLACMNNDIPIYFVGSFSSSKYETLVKSLAAKRGNVFFPGRISQDEVYKYYLKAKVHVLASFRESPGLVTLEAMRAGCNVVVSESQYCPIHYYEFDRYGFVCNPYSIEDIRNRIKDAYTSPQVSIPEDYFEFFSYDNSARLTIDAYNEIVT